MLLVGSKLGHSRRALAELQRRQAAYEATAESYRRRLLPLVVRACGGDARERAACRQALQEALDSVPAPREE